MQHGVQDLLVPARHQAHRPQQLQRRHLRLGVLSGKGLRYDVDARWVSKDVGAASLGIFFKKSNYYYLNVVWEHRRCVSFRTELFMRAFRHPSSEVCTDPCAVSLSSEERKSSRADRPSQSTNLF